MAEQVQAIATDVSRQRAADVQRGTARAAVLGVSDGLVTNVAMVLGISAAEASPAFVRLAGFASPAAGAFSIAGGGDVSRGPPGGAPARPPARAASLVLATVASCGIGALTARLSGRPLLWPALGQLLIVALAAAATVAVGRIFRVPVS